MSKSEQNPLSFTHPRAKKKQKWGRQKNASAKLKCLSKTKMPPINWKRRRPSQAFCLPFGFSRCVLMGISTSGFGDFCFEAGACGEIEIWRILSWHSQNMSKSLKEHENQNMGLFEKPGFFPITRFFWLGLLFFGSLKP